MNTPIKLVVTKAAAAPAKTIQGDCDSALMNNVANWVLSPISERKIVRKVELKTVQKLHEALFSPGFLSGSEAKFWGSSVVWVKLSVEERVVFWVKVIKVLSLLKLIHTLPYYRSNV